MPGAVRFAVDPRKRGPSPGKRTTTAPRPGVSCRPPRPGSSCRPAQKRHDGPSSGVGGPARYLAHRYGCRVTGLDITASRHQAAIRLTRLVGLSHWVDFRLGNALAMPFVDASFDVVIGQEAWAHIPDKPRLIAECARVVRPGGRIAFTDIVRGEGLSKTGEARLRKEMTFLELASAESYARLLEDAGCTVVERQDLGASWAEILRQRLEMYRGLKETTVERFGADHFRRWDDTYAFFVGLYGTGRLSGVRIVAERQPS